jgi:hypothetical protein
VAASSAGTTVARVGPSFWGLLLLGLLGLPSSSATTGAGAAAEVVAVARGEWGIVVVIIIIVYADGVRCGAVVGWRFCGQMKGALAFVCLCKKERRQSRVMAVTKRSNRSF